MRLLAPQTILNERPLHGFQIMVENGHLDMPYAAVEKQYKAGYIIFKKRFLVVFT